MEERYDPMEHGYDPMECKSRLDYIFVQNAPPYKSIHRLISNRFLPLASKREVHANVVNLVPRAFPLKTGDEVATWSVGFY